jgi:hypothetical protein
MHLWGNAWKSPPRYDEQANCWLFLPRRHRSDTSFPVGPVVSEPAAPGPPRRVRQVVLGFSAFLVATVYALVTHPGPDAAPPSLGFTLDLVRRLLRRDPTWWAR